jgi:succinate dehydrogenase / fumarate reductase, membrane anchor subunit
MVKSASSLTQSGVRDFLLQRVSASYLAFFLIGFVLYLGYHPAIDFYSWHAVFENTLMKVAVFFFFLSLMIHAWIGMWMVITDYLHDTFTRLGFLIVVMGLLLVSLVWSTAILWGR